MPWDDSFTHPPAPASAPAAASAYTTDLTQMARDGLLDPVIGRDREIRRAMRILARRSKNNPVLIGQPGVGKTAVVEGIAARIVSGDVPESLQDKRILSLDLGQLLAGTRYRGDFEERLRELLRSIEGSSGSIVLFIDELHMLVGAGNDEGGADAANLLKPALARGTFHCIGATTIDEYEKHVVKDKALERRFQPVLIREPDVADTIAILRGIKERYEVHHGIRIKDAALHSAARLSRRYIADRYLPDKAIDLIDEAASRLKLEIESVPSEIDDAERVLWRLRMEHRALHAEVRAGDRDRLHELEADIAERERRIAGLHELWREQKALVGKIKQLLEVEEALRAEADQVMRSGDLDRATEITYGGLPELSQRIEALETQLHASQLSGCLLREAVTPRDIAEIAAEWTGIPVEHLISADAFDLCPPDLEARLRACVLGQDPAVAAIVRTLAAAKYTHSRAARLPLYFVGPGAVGKRHSARAVADILLADLGPAVTIDLRGRAGFGDIGAALARQARTRICTVAILENAHLAGPMCLDQLAGFVISPGSSPGSGSGAGDRRAGLRASSRAVLAESPSEQGLDDAGESAGMLIVIVLVDDNPRDPGQKNSSSGSQRVGDILAALSVSADSVAEFSALDRPALAQLLDRQVAEVRARASHFGAEVTVAAPLREWLIDIALERGASAAAIAACVRAHLRQPVADALHSHRQEHGDKRLVLTVALTGARGAEQVVVDRG